MSINMMVLLTVVVYVVAVAVFADHHIDDSV